MSHPSISELARHLARDAKPALLDCPLDRLDDRADSDEARLVFTQLHESGEAHTLRDALEDTCLVRWVRETCTSSEASVVADQLCSWLGITDLDSIGGDDLARLSKIDELPLDPEALVRWAKTYEIAGELLRPTTEVFPDELWLEDEISVLDAACAEFSEAMQCLPDDEQSDLTLLTRDYLRSEAATSVGPHAREALWQRSWPTGPLSQLGERLREYIGGFEPASLAALRFVPTRPVSFDGTSGACSARLRALVLIEVSLQLGGFEHRPITGTCEACSGTRCIHSATLAARLIDACLDDRDRLHAPLQDFVRVPTWQRFLDAVAAPVPEPSELELHFEIRLEDRRVLVGVHSRSLRGSSLRPKLAAPQRALRSKNLDERDRSVLEAMMRCARTRGPELVPADLALLRALVDHPKLRETDTARALSLRQQRVRVDLIAEEGGVVPRVTLAGVPVEAQASEQYVLWYNPVANTLVFAELTPSLHRLLRALKGFRGVLPGESHAALTPWLESLRDLADVSMPTAVGGDEVPPPDKLLLRLSARFDEGVDVALCMRVFPLSPLWPPGQGEERTYGLVDGRTVCSQRNLEREVALARAVVDALELGSSETLYFWNYSFRTDVDALELLSRVSRLGDQVDVEWADPERQIRNTSLIVSSDLSITLLKGGGYLKVEGEVELNNKELSIRRLIDAASAGDRFVPIQGRDYAEIEQTLLDRLKTAQLSMTLTAREIRIILAAAPTFLEQLGDQTEPADAATAAWLEKLGTPAAELPSLDAVLEARLRPYQRDGARWLLQRAAWAPGACLADEMGLGKTVQSIAVLVQRAAAGPAMVVAPTSVIANWQAELAKFAPGLRACAYRGSQRHQQLEGLGPGAVLIVSYDVLLRDREQLAPISFATQIIDEAQAVSNPRTRRAKACVAMTVGFRIALTGTPIENRIGDLWSLFALIAPGMLGTWRQFRMIFGEPVDRYENDERTARLRAVIGPLILRRMKVEVASDLPARIEIVKRVTLSVPERDLYQTALKRAVIGLIRDRPRDRNLQQQPGAQVLAELNRLRQLACHPRLVIPDEGIESSKLHVFLGLLDEILPQGHRVLVFSQFARLLKLVREAITQRGIRSLCLDGSVPGIERADLVKRFQDGEAEVFLISLKAGGTGLNLTAADYVVHLDPWWNPAALDQASDRAHRIGQERPVTIVKLIAEGTIEERILELHEHKRWLATAVLAEGASAPAFDREMLEVLLRSD